MAVSRIHSSNARIYLGTTGLKGITKYDFSFDQEIATLQGLGDYHISNRIKNPNQKVDFSLSWILATGSNDPFYDFRDLSYGIISTQKFDFTIKDLAGSNFISGAYLTNYSVGASVGNLVEGSLKYEADGLFYSTGDNLLITDQTSHSYSPLLPSNIDVSFSNSANTVSLSGFAIQSFSFEIPIQRKPITLLGQNVPSYRYPQLPIIAPIKFSVVKNQITGINFSNLLLPTGSISFSLKDCNLKGYTYSFNNASLKSISESLGIDGNAQLDFNYEASIIDSLNNKSFNRVSTLETQSAVSALASLAPSIGTLNPAFIASTTTYSTTVSNTTTSVTLTPTVADATSTVKVNAVTVASSSASTALPLEVGANTIVNEVTAQDGRTKSRYIVTVTRAGSAVSTLSNLVPSSGTLSPTFAAGTTSYTANVTNATTSITLTPTKTDANSTITVNGAIVASGSVSGSLALAVGANTLTTVVTAQDGTTISTYTVVVTRAASLVIGTQPSSLTIQSGNTATLAVVASGVNSLIYEWYQGQAGNTAVPVGTNSASFTTFSLTSTASFWVNVIDASGVLGISETVVLNNANLALATQIVEHDNPKTTSVHTGDFSTVATGEDIILWKPINFITLSGVDQLFRVPSSSGDFIFTATKSEIISQSEQRIELLWKGRIINSGVTKAVVVKVVITPPITPPAIAGTGNIVSLQVLSQPVFPYENLFSVKSTTATVSIIPASVPSALTYSNNPATYINGTAITSNTPTSNGGAVVSYSVSPALPAGLTLNTSTGIISGTPTTLAAVATYTITATNTGGSTTAAVSIKVNAVVPSALTYLNTYEYAKDTAIINNTPSSSGGVVVSYAVSPALPAGLSLNTSTGIISGTPTILAAAANYTITATNTGGSTSVTLSITVNTAVDSAIPTLVNLVSSSGPLTPTFDANTTSYTAVAFSEIGFSGMGSYNSTGVVEWDTPRVTSIHTNDFSSTPTAEEIQLVNVMSFATSTAINNAIRFNSFLFSFNLSTNVILYQSASYVVVKSTGTVTKTGYNTSAATVLWIFNLLNYRFTATLKAKRASVTLTPTVTRATSTVTVNGATVTSGLPSAALSLEGKCNILSTVVTAQDKRTISTYKVAIDLPSSVSTLANLVLSGGDLNTAFATGTTSYTANVSNTTASVTLTPTLTTTPAVIGLGATIIVNGVAVISGTASASLPLAVGSNVLTIVVVSADGTITSTYTVTVTRVSSGFSYEAGLVAKFFNGSFRTNLPTGNITGYSLPLTTTSNSTITNGGAGRHVRQTIDYAFDLSGSGSTNNYGFIAIGYFTPPTTGVYYFRTTSDDTSGAWVGDLALEVQTRTKANATVDNGLGVASGQGSASRESVAISLTAGVRYPIRIVHEDGTGLDNMKFEWKYLSGGTYSTNLSQYFTHATLDGTATGDFHSVVSTLANLVPSSGTLSPAFAAGTTSYTATVSNAISSITLTPTRTDANSTIRVNGTAVTSGSASAALPLIVGDNTLTIVVTAANGSTTTYTVVVTRAVAVPSITYTTPVTYTKDILIANNTPTSSGGAVVSYSVSPALPAGLTLSTSTGIISGTPTTPTAVATYTIIATNTGGSTTASLSITVNAVAPTGLIYSTRTAVYTKDTIIGNNTPINSGGTVVSYAVSPTLPAGLTLNTSTGVISGTPTSLIAATDYTITATNTGGSATASVTITVNAVGPSALTYSTNPATYTKDSAITNNTPTNSGGAVVSYSVSPALPAGLTLNTSTGVISGTPTAVTAVATYTITATNTGGAAFAYVIITVASGVSTLSDLFTNFGTLSPAFAAGTTNYTATVSNATASVTLTPTRTDATSTITVNGTAVTSGSASASINLNVGSNTLTTVVTAGNGSTTTYTVVVTKTGSSSGFGYLAGLVAKFFDGVFRSQISTGNFTNFPLPLTTASASSKANVEVGRHVRTTIDYAFDLSSGNTTENYGFIAIGYFTPPTTGVYYFRTTSDDSSGVWVGDLALEGQTRTKANATIDNGLGVGHASTPKESAPITLTAGVKYPIRIVHEEGEQLDNMKFEWKYLSGGTYSTDLFQYFSHATLDGAATGNFHSVVSTLASLVPSSGTLSPTFAAGTISYTATVTNAISSITLTPTRTDANSTITVNGAAVTSGSASASINLDVGSNTLTTIVTAANGSTTTYIVTMTRAVAVAPSALTYSSNPVTYTKNSVITNNTPTSSGEAVVSYSVSPALPAGLTLSTSTGVISGTPSAVTAATSYTVTATNTGGFTTASVSITVNDIAPSVLTYSSNPATYTKDSAITNNTPTNSGGAVVSYSVSPALPAGLTLNTSTGVISGTPSAVTAATSYTVTATNTGGFTTASVSITVNAATNTFTVTNSGSGSYMINGVSNATLNIVKGQTYTFNITALGHPFWIKTVSSIGTGNAYNTGVTNNGTDNGTITFVVPSDAPSILYYNCQFHSGMAGTINLASGDVNVYGWAAENTTLTLTAPSGYFFSSVVYASYGNGTSTTQGNCHSATSSSVVSNAFIGKTSGTLSATNGNFGDPCSGTAKTLNVTLKCLPLGWSTLVSAKNADNTIVSTEGTLISARRFGLASNITMNTVTFIGTTQFDSQGTGYTNLGFFTDYGTATTEVIQLFNSLTYNGVAPFTYNVGPLVSGQTYMLQWFFADERSTSSARTQIVTINGYSITFPAQLTAKTAKCYFVATATSVNIVTDGLDGGHIEAFQIRRINP